MAEPRAARVVMLAGNDIIPDARVLKYAHTVAGFGLDVVAVGIGGPFLTGERTIGAVRVICPPVPERAAVSGWRHRLSAAKPWFSDPAPYRRALARWEYAARELDARDVGHKGARRALLRLRRKVLAARARPIRWARNRPYGGVGQGRERRIRLYRLLGLARWRAVMPEIIDAELTLGPLLDELAPDLIHLHDVYLLGVGARAVQRAAAEGRPVRLVYDAHEYVPGTPNVPARRAAAYLDLESEFMPHADRIVTVSDPLAEWLARDYALSAKPDVVLNAPIDPPAGVPVVGVRELAGLAEDVPLLVYGGGVNRARGVNTIVEALPDLPDAHLVIVARGNSVVVDLGRLAERLGVAERVHVVPYVDAELVPPYLASASIGVSSLLRAPNHDIAVTNKFCEYIAAGLPIVTSGTPAQAALVRELDLGAVYPAGSAGGLAEAVREVLKREDDLRARIKGDADLRFRFSWSAQAGKVRTIYDELLGGLPGRAWEERALHIHDLLGQRSA